MLFLYFFYLTCAFRTVEIRSPEEIIEHTSLDSGDETAGPSSATASISHSKPSRPGRGKTKVTKFKADDADDQGI